MSRRRYRPFLVFNPRSGWWFYVNRSVSPYTTRSIGTHRKIMRERVGPFVDPSLAIMFEKAAQL